MDEKKKSNVGLKDKIKLNELFKSIDKSHDNKIDIDELVYALEQIGVTEQKRLQRARRILNESGGQSSITFRQFINYALQQENKLRLLFKNLDLDSS
ncbi:unnamed protein product, partial [Didymodactylos carnosus]